MHPPGCTAKEEGARRRWQQQPESTPAAAYGSESDVVLAATLHPCDHLMNNLQCFVHLLVRTGEHLPQPLEVFPLLRGLIEHGLGLTKLMLRSRDDPLELLVLGLGQRFLSGPAHHA